MLNSLNKFSPSDDSRVRENLKEADKLFGKWHAKDAWKDGCVNTRNACVRLFHNAQALQKVMLYFGEDPVTVAKSIPPNRTQLTWVSKCEALVTSVDSQGIAFQELKLCQIFRSFASACCQRLCLGEGGGARERGSHSAGVTTSVPETGLFGKPWPLSIPKVEVTFPCATEREVEVCSQPRSCIITPLLSRKADGRDNADADATAATFHRT